MSVLASDGVKFGDTQMTVTGIVIAACFLFISRSRPLEQLSPQRPHTQVFCGYMMASILSQFAVHLYYLILAFDLTNATEEIKPPEDFDEAKFAPTLINTVVFLFSTLQQVTTFGAN